MHRPVHLCRTWLFIDGADEEALDSASNLGADVLMQELEDFTPPDLRPKARALAPQTYARWRDSGHVVAVRVNPLEADGMDDLAEVMKGAPHIVALPKVAEPEHVVALDAAVTRFERDYGLPEGSTRLMPNVELARGLVQTGKIADASPRTVACLMASEDMAADLGAEREPDSRELDYCRQRFLVECVAAGTVAVDCPYTWADAQGAERDTKWARRLGYKAKSAVNHAHVEIINKVLTPSIEEVRHAEEIVSAFDTARALGEARVEVNGSIVEVPTYTTAKRLLERAAALQAAR